MNTFHSRQTDCDRHARKNENTGTLNFTSQIAPSICTVIRTKRVKRDATIFKSRAVARFCATALIGWKPYPLSRQGFYGSPIARRKLRGVPRDGRAMGAKHPARNPAKYLASCPRNFPAMAGQRQQQCRRTSVKTTRRRLALRRTWPRNSRETSRKMTRQNPAVMFSTIPL